MDDDVALGEPTECRLGSVQRDALRARAALAREERQRRRRAGRHLGLALDERGLDVEPALREVVVDLELDLRGSDESPSALGGGLADHTPKFGGERLLGLL